MAYFATEYTIHFDDTMAYGSHHFLTAFKFQCAARESLLFGEQVFDVAGVRDALDLVHLITADAYARNLGPARLGDRVAILLTLEEWGRVSARFCYRAIDAHGRPISAGFQTLICADATTGTPISLPTPLRGALDRMREIEEPPASESFRDRVLAGGTQLESLFGIIERQTATHFLSQRHPSPQVTRATAPARTAETNDVGDEPQVSSPPDDGTVEAWVFSGQGTFDPKLLSERVAAYTSLRPAAREELDQSAAVAEELIGGDALALVSGSADQCGDAVRATPDLSQVAIHLQNVLGARLRQSRGHRPRVLVGHSFGEIAALGVGGCFDLPTGVRIVCERVRAIAEHATPDGGLMVVSTNRHRVATEATLLGLDEVMIAGRNHERQTVVSGPLDQLNRLREFLRSIDINAATIPSPTSFHHPQLRAAARAWCDQLSLLKLTGPSISVYSPIGRRFISPDDNIAATLASQLLRPFDLQGGIADIIEMGATTFVDCGSSGSLASIISQAGPDGLEVSGVAVNAATAPASHISAEPKTTSVVKRWTNRHATSRSNGSSQPKEGTDAADDRHVVPPVGIVGQGCILPGGANSPEQLYFAITEQRMGIVDQRRFDPHWTEDFYSEKLVPDRSTSHLMGLIHDDDIVVPAGVDPDVFMGFTRTQRLLSMALATCIESLEGAERVLCLIGATADGFEDQDVVSSLRFAGIDPCDQEVDRRLNTARSAFQQPHDAIQEVFDRIVRPGLEITLVDAACASSLYTVALGMQVLESNKADAVIAGGVFCPGPGNSCLFSQFQGMTATGCRPFDATADGVVFSEGSSLVTLRRVADAEQLGLPIAAVLRGAGLSSDGRSSSANVPQSKGQILSLQRCYANHDIDPASVHAIECHGTSTPVGDSTELETLRAFFSACAPNPIPLHSLKGLLGHAGWAAGAASVIAACQYLSHGCFPAQACHRQASDALIKSARTLTVPLSPLSLPSGHRRIAIDGFGFGGANAHLVLDSHRSGERIQDDPRNVKTLPTAGNDELVFVAYHELVPTLQTASGRRFDRDHTQPPDGHILLPDLADDMDISQMLAILLVDAVIAELPEFGTDLRRETSVVLAHSGKTERGIEATMRVLAKRFRRILAGLEVWLDALDSAVHHARPSGPYTLQCMMPNVSAGRAALQLNLNGPNFVVDSGSNSLEAAMASASLLLRSGDEGGTRLAVVAAIDANSLRIHRGNPPQPEDEYAAAFAVTTRRYAEELGLNILSPVEQPLQTAAETLGIDQGTSSTAKKVRFLLDTLGARPEPSANSTSSIATNADSKADSELAIHVPVWVEAPL